MSEPRIANTTLATDGSHDEAVGMDTPLMVSVLGVVAAVASGIISGIWSPWTKHKIELMMAMRESRRQAIERWRAEITNHPEDIRTWRGMAEIAE
jgi:hypothetical protein